jgi:uncharacterized membrane protein
MMAGKGQHLNRKDGWPYPTNEGDSAMSTLLIALSTWLHILATIVMIGYFIFAGLIYLPVFERQLQPIALCNMLEQVSARLRPFFGGSLLIFLVTGTHLMLINKNYLGLGTFFDNPWSVLIVIKHVLVLAFLALAIFSERAFLPRISDQKPRTYKQFRRALHINTVLGVVILLLTSLAQAG